MRRVISIRVEIMEAQTSSVPGVPEPGTAAQGTFSHERQGGFYPPGSLLETKPLFKNTPRGRILICIYLSRALVEGKWWGLDLSESLGWEAMERDIEE